MSHPPLPPGGPPISPPPGPPHGMPHGVPHSAPPPSGGPPLPSGPPPPGHPPVVHQPPGYPPADTSSYYGGGYGAYPGYPPAPQGYPPAPPQGYYQSPYPPTSSYPPSQVAVRPTMRPAAPHVNPPPGTLGASPKQYSPSPSGTKEARTLYITGIDQSVDEQTFREFFASYFPVVRCRLAGDSEHPSRFGFMELEKESDAADMTTYSMQVKLKGRPLRIVHSKAAIQSENAQSSRVSQAGAPRTIHCTGFPAAATEKELVDYFQLKLNIGMLIARLRTVFPFFFDLSQSTPYFSGGEKMSKSFFGFSFTCCLRWLYCHRSGHILNMRSERPNLPKGCKKKGRIFF